jgi:hypothetical protein
MHHICDRHFKVYQFGRKDAFKKTVTRICVCDCVFALVVGHQVVTLRTVYEKLLRLLPGGKQQALSPERVSEPFSGLNPLHYNPYTEVGDFMTVSL